MEKIKFLNLSFIQNLTFIIIFSVLTLIELGDPLIRMSYISNDDSFVAHSYAYTFSSRYSDDIFMSTYQNWVNSSILNFIPAILLSSFYLDPKLLFLPVTVFQNVALYYSVGLLAKSFIKNDLAFWLAGLFFYLFSPQLWNLGWFGELDWMPYGMWLALPFIVLSFKYLCELEITKALVVALVAQLIHPTFGILWAIFLTIIIILKIKRKTVKQFFLLVSLFILFGGNYLRTLSVKEISKPRKYFEEVLEYNGHYRFVNPFDSLAPNLTIRAWLFLLIFVGFGLLLTMRRRNANPIFAYFALYCLLLLFIDQLAIYLKYEPLVLLGGTRTSVALLVIACSLFIAYLTNLILSHSKLDKIIGILIFTYPLPFIILPYILFILFKFSASSLKSFSKTYDLIKLCYIFLYLATIGTFLAFYHLNRYDFNNFFYYRFISGGYLDPRSTFFNEYLWTPIFVNQPTAIIYLIVLFALFFAFMIQKYLKISLIVFLACLIVIGSIGARNDLYAYGYRADFETAKDRKDSLIWINENTSEDADFIAALFPYGFRSITNRSVIWPGKLTNTYSYTPELDSWNRAMEDFSNRFYETKNVDKSEKSFYTNFATKYDIEYIWMPKSWADIKDLKFDLKIAHENKSFILYSFK
jgi:hypothetical protein